MIDHRLAQGHGPGHCPVWASFSHLYSNETRPAQTCVSLCHPQLPECRHVLTPPAFVHFSKHRTRPGGRRQGQLCDAGPLNADFFADGVEQTCLSPASSGPQSPSPRPGLVSVPCFPATWGRFPREMFSPLIWKHAP